MIYLEAILLLSGTLVLFAAALLVAERYLLNYGPCTIEIEGRKDPLVVPGGQDLLTALTSEAVYVPSMCGRRGNCGHCKVKVLSGGEPTLPTELLYLTQEELSSRTRLACQVKVRENLRIRLSGTLLAATRYRSRVTSVLALTPAVKEIRLRLEDPKQIAFTPAQYIQVEVPAKEGEPVFRAYSIASPVYENAEVALDVQLIPGGVGSSWLHRLKVGDVVHFTGPYGEFRLNDDPQVEVVCVAGGCGLAPMKSIVYSVLDRWPDRTCRLFYGIRTAEDAVQLPIYRRLAERFPNFHFVCAISDSLEDSRRLKAETGFIHRTVDRLMDAGTRRQAFVCGPQEMIEAVAVVLAEKGVRDIYFDRL